MVAPWQCGDCLTFNDLPSDSYRADEAYLNWVESARDGCPSTSRLSLHLSAPSFGAVERANKQASQDKAAFLTRWNPVAEQFGLPTRDAKNI